MKKFWKKYKGLILVLLALAAFVGLSFLGESAGKEENGNTTEPSADITEWKTAVESDESVITVIALSYCSHCEDYKPVINKIVNNYGIKLFWFEIDTMSESDATTVTNSYAFSEYTGSSPYTAITKAGSVVGQTVGFLDEATTMEFLNTYDLAK